MKRLLSLLLALSLLPALSPALPRAAAAESPPVVFTDISDPETRKAASLLAALDIVSGVGGGRYDPDGNFTRAHLAAITCKLSGIFDVSAYTDTVKFPDVRAGHWAHGWIMAAFALGIVTGDAQGNYDPDRPMEYRYLVTVLMRLLGYTDADVGVNWPTSYITKAQALGLSQGMSFSPGDILTRGQVARLICNFLYMIPKNATQSYMELKLGVSSVSGVIRFFSSLGKDYAEMDGSAYPLRMAPDASQNGRTGSLLILAGGQAALFTPDPEYTYQTVTVRESYAGGVRGEDGALYALSSITPVWPDGKLYATLWIDIFPGELLLLAYRGGPQPQYVYRAATGGAGGEDGVLAVLTSQPVQNPLPALFGQAALDAVIVKNGAYTTWRTLERWDVLVYSAQAGRVMVSNTRFNGYYEKGLPGAVAPTSAMVSGLALDLWPEVSQTLTSKAPGSRLVFLLDHEGKVASVQDPANNALYAPPALCAADPSGGAVVRLNSGLTFPGAPQYQGSALGQLCYLTNSVRDFLTVSPIALTPASADLDIGAMTLGSAPVAPWCAVYECAGDSGIVSPVRLSDIPAGRVPKDRVLHAQIGPSGYVTTLLLDNVTGDCYHYGILSSREVVETIKINDGSTAPGAQLAATQASLSGGSSALSLNTMPGVLLPPDGTVTGLSVKTRGGNDLAVGGAFACAAIEGLDRYAFATPGVALAGGSAYPMATDSVYLEDGGASVPLSQARALCTRFTIYLDPVAYKVRFIVGQ